MQTFKKYLLLALIVFQTGCLYLDTKVPLDTDASQSKLGDKVGVSSVRSVLWLFSWGDGGVAAAAKNGGITTINHLDNQVYMVLFGLYTRIDTVAYGE